jgi:hypothetical protein
MQARHDRRALTTAGTSATDGKCASPTNTTQAPDPSERGTVGGRLHARVGRRADPGYGLVYSAIVLPNHPAL